jgi:hypothetical protein
MDPKKLASALAAAIALNLPSLARAAEEGAAAARPAESQAPATSAVEAPATNLFLETDPAMFVLGGFAGHVRLRVPPLPHWSFGVGAYGLTLPGIMVDIDSADRGQGWTSRITFALGAFVDRFFRDDGEGAFLGAQIGSQTYRVTRSDAPGDATFTNVLVMPRVGYLWHPFRAGFYVMPWLGVGATARLGNEPVVAGRKYDVFPVVAFATVHVGWSF